MFDDFPYSSKGELNLDWIIAKMKELEQRVEALERGGGNNGNV